MGLETLPYACMAMTGKQLEEFQNRSNATAQDMAIWKQESETVQPFDVPWAHNMTQVNVDFLLQQGMQFVSQEFPYGSTRNGMPRPLSSTRWEDPRIVSVFIIRHPLTRLAAGDGFANRYYGDPKSRTKEQWWSYAKLTRPVWSNTDNFMLHKLCNQSTALRSAQSLNETLSQDYCCHGQDTSHRHLEAAKQLLRRFTYVLDIECLDDGMDALAEELGLISIEQPNSFTIEQITKGDNTPETTNSSSSGAPPPKTLSPPPKRRPHHKKQLDQVLKYQDVYEFLRRRNRVDIELYEWAKTLSLVQCPAPFSYEYNKTGDTQASVNASNTTNQTR